jgi:hypothetical protein
LSTPFELKGREKRYLKKKRDGWIRWHKLATLALGRLRQEDLQFKGSLGYIARLPQKNPKNPIKGRKKRQRGGRKGRKKEGRKGVGKGREGIKEGREG